MSPLNRRAGGRQGLGTWPGVGLVGLLLVTATGPAGMIDEPRTPVYQPLPGHATGLLIGHCADALAAEGRFGPADAVFFALGDASYRLVFVPAERDRGGETLSLRRRRTRIHDPHRVQGGPP